MKKQIALLIGFLLVLSACEDTYVADLDSVENMLVIEALLTNNASANYVKLTETRNFYSTETVVKVADATVTIVDGSGNEHVLAESSIGYFVPDFDAVPGETYKIKVEADGETYESDYELLPPVPTVDSLYAASDSQTTYTYDSYGQPMATEITGMTVYADLPKTSDLSHYRFSLPRTMEYIVPPPDEMPTPPTVWSWLKFAQSGVFPIEGPAEYSSETSLTGRSLIFLQNKIDNFVTQEKLDSGAYMVGWVVDMSVFGLSEKSYKFYESVNAQLEADGKLFDPVYAQLEPNFTCTSDPDKDAVGYFEVSSYRFQRFFVMAPRGSTYAYFHLVDDPVTIPASGQLKSYTAPDFWEDR